jgi:tryptophan-rich sensory protein
MEFLVAAAPAILTSSTQFSSHVRKEQQNAGKNVPSRPPRITFSIVWICLYILMFITFLLVYQANDEQFPLLFTFSWMLLSISLAAWTLVYAFWGKKAGLYAISISWTLSLMIHNATSDYTEKAIYTSAPLVGWLTLATLLNFEEVNRMH